MITELTKEQEAMIPVWIQKCLDNVVALTDIEKCESAIDAIYEAMGEKKPIKIVSDSPYASCLADALHTLGMMDEKGNIDSGPYSDNVVKKIESEFKKIKENYYLSTWWMAWSGMYSFAKEIGVVFDEKEYNLFTNYVDNVMFIIPYRDIAFYSRKPVEISWKNNLLHNEHGPCCRWKDGYSMYALEGISVPKWLIETPKENLSAIDVLKIENVEVRAVALRFIGYDKLLKETDAKKIDTKYLYCDEEFRVWLNPEMKEDIGKTIIVGSYKELTGVDDDGEFTGEKITITSRKPIDYELYEVDVREEKKAKLLRMKNPSTGLYHCEFVSNECNKVEEALEYRNGVPGYPVFLS
jgi:hypothetical protein